MKNTLFLLLCFLILNVNAQTYPNSWAKGFGGTTQDIGNAITSDDSGNVYITGLFTGTIDFDPSNNTHFATSTLNDFFVLKLNKFGDFQWVKTFISTGNETGWDITLDQTGNILVCGHFNGSVDFDPGPGVFNLISNTNIGSTVEDIFILKLDVNGNYIWAKKFGNTSSDQARSIEVDINNNILCTGFFAGNVFGLTSNGSTDCFVLKLTASGNQIWARRIGSSLGDSANSLCLDISSNIYISGGFQGSCDFDPGVGQFLLSSNGGIDGFVEKLDFNGNFVWAKSVGSINYDILNSVTLDENLSVYVAGEFNVANANGDIVFSKFDNSSNQKFNYIFSSTASETVWQIKSKGNFITLCGQAGSILDLNPSFNNSFNIKGWTGFLSTYDTSGTFQFVETFALNTGVSPRDFVIDNEGNRISTGYFQGESIFDTQSGLVSLNAIGNLDIFTYRHPKKSVFGRVFNDYSGNCIQDFGEAGISGVSLNITPGDYVVQTNQSGIWSLDSLPSGNYTIWMDSTFGSDYTICSYFESFSVNSFNDIIQVNPIGLQNNFPCSDPNISIYAPFLRPCFSNQKIYIAASNDILATDILDSSNVLVELNPNFTIDSASLPFTALGNNTYNFDIGSLYPGQNINFNISTTLNCQVSNGQTLCMEATLFPAQTCALDTVPSTPPTNPGGTGTTLNGFPQPCTLPWDQSSLSVDGWCQNDTIYFTVTNTGDPGGGDMECYAPLWVTVDGVVTYTDSILIPGGQTITYTFPGDGATWILNASQHPLHPGNSQPNAHVEACGDTTNWTPGLVNELPLDDADPVVDIYCGVVTGSYDPNDKTGYPLGQTDQRYVQPNQQLQYVVRFQNTGTDTAFTVVIRDTLDTDLNIFTVTPGVSSHEYEFQMYGPRVLEWTFNNINLPDSTTNEEGSNGFVTFHVEQVPNLAPGTEITNDADIYFDFNAPITTNTTMHRIYEGFVSVAALEEMSKEETDIKVYPNPNAGTFTVVLKKTITGNYTVFDQQGRAVQVGKMEEKKSTLNLDLQNGVYFLMVGDDVVKVQVVR